MALADVERLAIETVNRRLALTDPNPGHAVPRAGLVYNVAAVQYGGHPIAARLQGDDGTGSEERWRGSKTA